MLGNSLNLCYNVKILKYYFTVIVDLDIDLDLNLDLDLDFVPETESNSLKRNVS